MVHATVMCDPVQVHKMQYFLLASYKNVWRIICCYMSQNEIIVLLSEYVLFIYLRHDTKYVKHLVFLGWNKKKMYFRMVVSNFLFGEIRALNIRCIDLNL